MTKQKEDTPAKTRPRFSYRTPKEHKNHVEERIKELVEKLNSQESGDYYHIDQNTVFLEAVYRGLDYLNSTDLSPDNDEGWYWVEFNKKEK